MFPSLSDESHKGWSFNVLFPYMLKVNAFTMSGRLKSSELILSRLQILSYIISIYLKQINKNMFFFLLLEFVHSAE